MGIFNFSKKKRQATSFILSIFMLLSLFFTQTNVTYALEPGMPISDNSITENYVPKDPEQYVTVIVQLDDQCALDQLPKNQKLSSNNENISILKEKILSNQSSYKDEISKLDSNIKFKHSYSLLLNGFSFNVKRKDIEAIKSMPGVKCVEEDQIHYLEMNHAKALSNIEQVWNNPEYGYKGEGLVASVIDSGIDISHKDMRLTDSTKAKLKKADFEEGGKYYTTGYGRYYNDKIPYAVNFADRNYEIIDTNPNTAAHGMHVAGIIAANGTDEEVAQGKAIKGVAPEAQILSMKVITNSSDSTRQGAFTADIVAAIEDSVAHDADVINMSLGSSAGFVTFDGYEGAEQVAIRKAVESGVIVVVSEGNDRFSTYPTKYAEVVDTGLPSTPGVSPDALAVGSYENTKFISVGMDYTSNTSTGRLLYNKHEVSPIGVLNAAKGYELVDCGFGAAEDFNGKTLKGKIALIKRGGKLTDGTTIDFATKKLNAQKNGAAGAIIYNKDGETANFNMIQEVGTIKIPVMAITNADGLKLLGLIKDNLMVKFTAETTIADNPEANNMSEFSSWGPTSDLGFKPELSAPGGKIWSTVNSNKYETYSGTSMASPFAAGASILALQHINKLEAQNAISFETEKEKSEFVRTLEINTAEPKIDPATNNTLFFSPRRQGAGLLNAENAIKNNVTVLETSSNKATVALKEIVPEENNTTTREFTARIHNYGTSDANYKAVDLSGIMTEQGDTVSPMSYDVKLPNAEVSFDKNTVSVAPGQDVEVKVTLSIPKETKRNIFVEGFIKFESTDNSIPSIGIPYMGFYGKWDEPAIFDKPAYETGSITGRTAIIGITDNPAFTGKTNYLGQTGETETGAPIIDPSKVVMAPNNSYSPFGNDNIMMSLTLLRNAKTLLADVTDANGNVIKTIGEYKNGRKNVLTKSPASIIDDSAVWEGTTDKGGIVPDGMYYMRLTGTIDYPDARPQTLSLPVRVDSVPPKVKMISSETATSKKYTMQFTADDPLGIYGIKVKVNGKAVNPDANGSAQFINVKPDKDGVYSYTIDWEKSKYADGNYSTVTFMIYDYAGNAYTLMKNIYLNEQAGALKITSPSNNATLQSGYFDVNFEMTGSPARPIDKYCVYLDDEEEAILPITATNYTFKFIYSGTHKITVEALDKSGLPVLAASTNITVDTNNNTNTNLKYLEIEGTPITELSPGKTAYTFKTTKFNPKITSAIAESNKATVTISDSKGVGLPTIITVKSGDGLSSKNYYVTFTDQTVPEKISIEMLSSSSFSLGQDASVKFKITNNLTAPQEVTLIGALYDESNKFVTYFASSKVITNGSSETLFGMFKIPTSGTYKVKCFVWDNFQEMTSLSKVIEIPVK